MSDVSNASAERQFLRRWICGFLRYWLGRKERRSGERAGLGRENYGILAVELGDRE
jgi:hypothetical protein